MKRITIFFAILILAYLSGSFYSASFDVSIWELETRGTVVIAGLFIAFAVSTFPFIENIFE